MSNGYIYILTNPSFSPDLLKIGMTTRTPEECTNELYEENTGIPSKFVVSYKKQSINCQLAKEIAHKRLKDYRPNQYKEFFQLPLQQAILVIDQVVKEINELYSSKIESKLKDSEEKIRAEVKTEKPEASEKDKEKTKTTKFLDKDTVLINEKFNEYFRPSFGSHALTSTFKKKAETKDKGGAELLRRKAEARAKKSEFKYQKKKPEKKADEDAKEKTQAELVQMAVEVAREEILEKNIEPLQNGAENTFNAASPHPWNRFWARSIDYALFIVVFNIVIVVLALYLEFQGFSLTFSNNVLVNLSIWFIISDALIVLYEATWISTSGTTPGKMLFSIKVLTSEGNNLSFKQSVRRAFSVLASGFAFLIFFPVVPMIAMWISYKEIKNTGVAKWDKTERHQLIHKPIGNIRLTFGLVLGIVSLIILSSFQIVIKQMNKELIKEQFRQEYLIPTK